LLVCSSFFEILSEASATEYAGWAEAGVGPVFSAWTNGGIGGGSGHIVAVAVGGGSASGEGISGPAAATRTVGTVTEAGCSLAGITGSGCREALSMSRGPVERI
jgi:hypothetical protein